MENENIVKTEKVDKTDKTAKTDKLKKRTKFKKKQTKWTNFEKSKNQIIEKSWTKLTDLTNK